MLRQRLVPGDLVVPGRLGCDEELQVLVVVQQVLCVVVLLLEVLALLVVAQEVEFLLVLNLPQLQGGIEVDLVVAVERQQQEDQLCFVAWPLSELKRRIYDYLVIAVYQERLKICVSLMSFKLKTFVLTSS